MSYGIQTWDATGRPNNYGIVPVSVLGFVQVSQNQQSGGATFSIPDGYVMDALQACSGETYTQTRRIVVINGGAMTIGPAADNDFGSNTYPAIAGFIIAFLRVP